ncbi:MAG: host attachment protein [Amphiplicatus sp.]
MNSADNMNVKNSAPSPRIWVAVFDGARAVVYQNDDADDAPALRPLFGVKRSVIERSGAEARADARIGNIIPFTDIDSRAEAEFIRDFARRVEDHARRGHFERLVVIAPGECVRRFRDNAPAAHAKLMAVRIGDYVRRDVDSVAEAFKEAVEWQAPASESAKKNL